MNDSKEIVARETSNLAVAKLPFLAALVALCGVADAIYLTVLHYTGEKVPCSIVAGCEQVLTSSYAEIAGIPLAAFGALAYFGAFALSVLAAFGNGLAWKVFGVQVVLMAIFTAWLVYLQAFVINAFCQFCLVSAAITLALFTIFLVSKFLHKAETRTR
ncbi:MAG: vitamin K epoxide reductase family protein [Acidobacteria bacterium]|nr:vitamin K epoxide reductase family protein [Acidobacteriota bacterium]